MRIKYNSYSNDGHSISKVLEKMEVKHCFLEHEHQIVLLGKVGRVTYKGSILTEPIIFSTKTPKENMMFLATISKQVPEAINRLADLSRLLDKKNEIDQIKSLIKHLNSFDNNFKLLLSHLSENRAKG